jgi:hypothetical protein
MKNYIFLIIVLGLSALAGGSPSNIQRVEAADGRSSKCAVSSVKSSLQYAKAVFSGEVVGEEKNGDVKTFKFKVDKYWKGENTGTIEIFVYQTFRYQAVFKEGEKFLVYAVADEDGKLTVKRCSRSKDLRYAEQDLRELGAGQTPKY